MTENQIATAMARQAASEGHMRGLPRAPKAPGQLSHREMARAKSMLLDGYGAEDIAVKLRVNPDRVRAFIAKLRADGVLARRWGRE